MFKSTVLLILLLVELQFINVYSITAEQIKSIELDGGWWEIDKNDTNIRSRSIVELYLRKLDLDKRRVHSCYEYKLYDTRRGYIVRRNTFCYPSLIISGYKKCSTS